MTQVNSINPLDYSDTEDLESADGMLSKNLDKWKKEIIAELYQEFHGSMMDEILMKQEEKTKVEITELKTQLAKVTTSLKNANKQLSQ